nr:unnamed protein product [Digitaria exilis]
MGSCSTPALCAAAPPLPNAGRFTPLDPAVEPLPDAGTLDPPSAPLLAPCALVGSLVPTPVGEWNRRKAREGGDKEGRGES